MTNVTARIGGGNKSSLPTAASGNEFNIQSEVTMINTQIIDRP